MYHDKTAWRCAFFVGKKYGCSKGYPQLAEKQSQNTINNTD
jgi:hypothetical protein